MIRNKSIGRREAIARLGAGAACVALAGPLLAAQETAPSPLDELGPEVIRLWPGNAPGMTAQRPRLKVVNHSKDIARPDRTLTGVDVPALVVFRPAVPNGAAVLLMPGGGYEFEAFDNEGTRQAAWLNANGITAFVLVYRLPAEGWANKSLVPLQDAQRAMRIIRARAAEFGIDGNRVAALGFSAGGHLAGSLLTRFADKVYAPVDAYDSLSAKPLLAGLIYPVITLRPGITHAGTRAALIGEAAGEKDTAAGSVDRNVGPDTPPAFIMQTNDDTIVPVENAKLMYEAMLAAKHPVDLHIFDRGGHGFGVNLPHSEPASTWPDLFLSFARQHGLY